MKVSKHDLDTQDVKNWKVEDAEETLHCCSICRRLSTSTLLPLEITGKVENPIIEEGIVDF